MARGRNIPMVFAVTAVLLLLFCFFGFCFEFDIRHTVTSSYALLNGHIRDFYSYNAAIPSIEGNDYEIPVYLVFAFWNLPVKLAGLASADVFPFGVMLYNKLLVCVVFAVCAWLVGKIAMLLFEDRRTAWFSAASFFMCPIALYGPFLFAQYDSFYVALMLAGVWFILRNGSNKNLFFGTLLFGAAALFKPFAWIGLIPLLLFRCKALWKLAALSIPAVLPFLAVKAVLPGAVGSKYIGRLLESSVVVSEWGVFQIALFPVLYILLCLFAYFRNPPEDMHAFRLESILVLYAAYSVFFMLVLWHPMWLLSMMPFFVLTSIASAHRIRLLVVELLMTVGFAGTVFASWGESLAENLVANGLLPRLGLTLSEGWTVAGLLSRLPIPFFSVFIAALAADLALKAVPICRRHSLELHPVNLDDWKARLVVSATGILGLTLLPLAGYLL